MVKQLHRLQVAINVIITTSLSLFSGLLIAVESHYWSNYFGRESKKEEGVWGVSVLSRRVWWWWWWWSIKRMRAWSNEIVVREREQQWSLVCVGVWVCGCVGMWVFVYHHIGELQSDWLFVTVINHRRVGSSVGAGKQGNLSQTLWDRLCLCLSAIFCVCCSLQM